MNTEELIDEVTKDKALKDATSMITHLREANVRENKIYEYLVHDYGEDLTIKELKQLMKETK